MDTQNDELWKGISPCKHGKCWAILDFGGVSAAQHRPTNWNSSYKILVDIEKPEPEIILWKLSWSPKQPFFIGCFNWMNQIFT